MSLIITTPRLDMQEKGDLLIAYLFKNCGNEQHTAHF